MDNDNNMQNFSQQTGGFDQKMLMQFMNVMQAMQAMNNQMGQMSLNGNGNQGGNNQGNNQGNNRGNNQGNNQANNQGNNQGNNQNKRNGSRNQAGGNSQNGDNNQNEGNNQNGGNSQNEGNNQNGGNNQNRGNNQNGGNNRRRRRGRGNRNRDEVVKRGGLPRDGIIKVSARSKSTVVAGSVAKSIRMGTEPVLYATGAVCINNAVKAIAVTRQYLVDEGIDVIATCQFREKQRSALSFYVRKYPLKQKMPEEGDDEEDHENDDEEDHENDEEEQEQEEDHENDEEDHENDEEDHENDEEDHGEDGEDHEEEEEEEEEEENSDEKKDLSEGDELRVAGTSDPLIVAGSIAGKVREKDTVTIVCLGANSVSQTVKSICLARRYLTKDMLDLRFQPEFIALETETGRLSALKFNIIPKEVN